MNLSYYDILGVEPHASQEEIKAAWRASVKKFHPDAEGTSAQFRIFKQASDVLLNPDKRAAYDAELANDARALPRAEPKDAAEDTAWGEETGWGDEEEAWVDDAAPSSTSWKGQVDRDRELKVTPPFRRGLVPLVVVTVAWLTLSLTLGWLLVGQTNPWFSLVILVLGFLIIPSQAMTASPGLKTLQRVGLVAAGLLVVAAAILYRGSGEWLLSAWVAAVLVGVLAVKLLRERYARYRALDVSVTRQAAYEHNVFGHPGLMSERLSAALLSPVMEIPGSKLFHAVPWRGSGGGFGCAVVAGPKVALVDNQDSPRFDEAVTIWADVLTPADVRGFAVVDDDAGLDPEAGDLVSFVTDQRLAEAVGGFLVPGQGRVDRVVLDRISHESKL